MLSSSQSAVVINAMIAPSWAATATASDSFCRQMQRLVVVAGHGFAREKIEISINAAKRGRPRFALVRDVHKCASPQEGGGGALLFLY